MSDRSSGARRRGAAHGRFPFSRFITIDGWTYVSGLVGREPSDGSIAVGDAEAQTRATLGQLDSVLNEAGVGLEDVVKVTMYLTDLATFEAANRAYRDAFTAGQFPARTCIEVACLPDPEAMVEIDAVAYREDGE